MAIIRWSKGARGKRQHAFLGFAGAGFLHTYSSVRTEVILQAAVFATSALTANLTVAQGVVFLTRPENSFVKLPKGRLFVKAAKGRSFVKMPRLSDLQISA